MALAISLQENDFFVRIDCNETVCSCHLLDCFQKRLAIANLVRDAAQYPFQGSGLLVQLLEGILRAIQAVLDYCDSAQTVH